MLTPKAIATIFRFECEYSSITHYHSLYIQGTQSWLPNVTKSLLVRRCLLQDGGVQAVIKVGLEMGETNNWKRKEALASIVSVSKHPKVQEFYANIGPQITQSLVEVQLYSFDAVHICVMFFFYFIVHLCMFALAHHISYGYFNQSWS